VALLPDLVEYNCIGPCLTLVLWHSLAIVGDTLQCLTEFGLKNAGYEKRGVGDGST
jgi:hypothetical protein